MFGYEGFRRDAQQIESHFYGSCVAFTLSSAAIEFPWGDVIDNNVFDSVSWDIFHSWLGEVPQNIDNGWEMMHRRILTGGIITEMLYQAGCCQGMS